VIRLREGYGRQVSDPLQPGSTILHVFSAKGATFIVSLGQRPRKQSVPKLQR
jgi:hypothetical protein